MRAPRIEFPKTPGVQFVSGFPALHSRATRVIDGHAPNERRRDYQTGRTEKHLTRKTAPLLRKRAPQLRRRRPLRTKVPGRKRSRPQARIAPRASPGSRSEEGTRGEKNGRQAGTRQAGGYAARRRRGVEDSEACRTVQGSDLWRDHDGHGLAGAQRPGLPLDGGEEAQLQNRVHENRGWRSNPPDQAADSPRSTGPPARVAAFVRPRRSPSHRRFGAGRTQRYLVISVCDSVSRRQ